MLELFSKRRVPRAASAPNSCKLCFLFFLINDRLLSDLLVTKLALMLLPNSAQPIRSQAQELHGEFAMTGCLAFLRGVGLTPRSGSS